MKLTIRIARCGGGFYRAWCPALPGCEVYGQSRKEIKSRIDAAVKGYLARMDVAIPRELGRRNPIV